MVLTHITLAIYQLSYYRTILITKDNILKSASKYNLCRKNNGTFHKLIAVESKACNLKAK